MKKLSYLFFGLILFAFACKKDEVKPIAEIPAPKDSVQTEKSKKEK
jgi:hypothetical protein